MLRRLLRQVLPLVASLLLACAPHAVAAQDAAAPRGFMWEAARGAERVLLIGTIHVGRPEFATLRAAGTPALMRAEVIVFEANVFDAQASAAAAQRWALYPAGEPGLEARVDAATRARIDRIAARTGGNLPLCCRMKPWMVANTLVVLEAVAAGFSPAFGTEAQLYQFALAQGKKIAEIEDVEQQLRLFDDAPLDLQLDYLRHVLDSIEDGRGRAEIERLVGAWERGDEAAMQRVLQEMARGEQRAQRFVAERIVQGRHPRMVAAIERFAASGQPHAVAIGALHFFGPEGLLQLLRERGFALRRL
jgi:hypothetical protein